MAVQVRVQNFQSIKDSTVDIDGFTVVAGQNNAGKTALIRAVSGVFSNTPGHYYVRDGEDFCSVEIILDENTSVKWEKGPKIRPRYSVNGGPLIYPGKEVPQEVLDLGIMPITAVNQTLWPQIAQQFVGQVFLLDQPGSVVAETVADVERVGKLSKALKLAESDRRSLSSDLKVRRRDFRDLQLELEGYAGVDAITDEVDSIETQWREAKQVGGSILKVRELRDGLQQAQGLIDALAGVEDVTVPGPQAAQEASETRTSVSTLRDVKGRYDAAQALCGSLAGASELTIPEKQDASKLQEDIRSYTRLSGRLQAAQQAQDSLQGLPAVLGEISVEGMVDETAKCPKIQAALTTLKGIQERYARALTEMQESERLLRESQESQVGAEEEVRVILGDRGECPVCRTVVEKT